MSLLSRVAERIYWTARYLERAETSSRLARVYGNLLLDLPRQTGLGWKLLIEINGIDELFRSVHSEPTDDDAERFFVAERSNPSSVLSSLAHARENIRTTRNVVPSEAWRAINELYLFVTAELADGGSARRRHSVHSTVIETCHQMTGMLADTMSHGAAYQFFRIGRTLERADVTTRILDVAAATLLSGRPELERFDNALWMAVLQSLSAYQTYRQYVRRRILGPDVIAFLLEDGEFPRAFNYCLNDVERALSELPYPAVAIAGLTALRNLLGELSTDRVDNATLHRWLDEAQLGLAAVDEAIRATWFAPERPT